MALTVSVSGGENGVQCISFFGTPTVGANAILAAQGAGKSIRAYSYSICGAGADNIVYPATGSTGRFGGSGAAMTVNAAGPAGGVVKNHNANGWFTSAVNEALNIYASTAEAIFGEFVVKVIEQVLNQNGIPV